PVAEIGMMKNRATQTMAFCASEAVQIFGGAGFMRGIKVERIYREVKVNAIGGGTEEIMKDLASRQMGLCAMLFTAEHEDPRQTLQKFIAAEINPFVDEWEKA